MPKSTIDSIPYKIVTFNLKTIVATIDGKRIKFSPKPFEPLPPRSVIASTKAEYVRVERKDFVHHLP
jgi:hypothetical protein